MHFKSFDKIESDLEYDIDISNPVICANQNIVQSLIFRYYRNSQGIAILILSIHEYSFHCQDKTYEKTSISFVCRFCLNTRTTRFLFYVVKKVPHSEIGSINHI